MIDNFTEAEWSGRTFTEMIFNDRNITNYHFTPSRFDRVDVFWEKNGKKYVGEIKYRINYASTSSTISNEGTVIEKIKYDALKEYQDLSGITPYYINYYSDGVCALFNLTDMDIQFKTETKYPKTTMGDKKKVKKDVGYIKLSEGKTFQYNTYVHNDS